MKKLKKVLSLVLVLAMCFSAFGVSAFAANYDGYKDADTVKTDYAKNETAIDVVTGLGIINGDDGYLNLGNGLTRAEAAKILAVVDLGTKTAASVNSSTVSTGYSDMKGHWASGYVAYATAKKYLTGNGDGTFEPDSALTGYAFGKMMLNVLGYGLSDNKLVDGTTVKENKYEGDLWEINVLADGTEHNLFDKVDADLADDLTRADAMQIVYNTLLQVTAAKDDEKAGAFYDVAKELEITAPLTSNVKVNEGRPTVTVYNAKGDKLTSYAATPDYTFTAKAPGDNIASINKELNKKGPDALTVDGTMAYENAAQGNYDVVDGDDVEVYLKPGSKTEIAVIVSTHYDLVKIADVKPLTTRELNANAKSDDPAVKNAKNWVSFELNNATVKVYDTQFAGFDYEKDQYVLVAVKADKKAVLASAAAETVSGKITATKGTGATMEVAVDGTYYKVSMNDSTAEGYPELDKEGTWALDKAGKIGAAIKVDEVSSDYALIYNAVENTTRDEDGKEVTSHTVYVIKADGTKDSFTVANIPGAFNMTDLGIGEKKEVDSKKVDSFKWDGTPVLKAYTLNDKGEIVAAKAKNEPATATTSKQIDKDNATVVEATNGASATPGVYVTSSTNFIFVDDKAPGGTKAEVVTGYKNVVIAKDKPVYYVADKGNVLYAFIMEKNGVIGSTTKYAVLLNETPVVTKEGPDSVYTYTVAVDGKETTLTTTEAKKLSGVDAGTILPYEMKGNKAEFDTMNKKVDTDFTKPSAATADYIIWGTPAKQYAVTGKTEFYKITKSEGMGPGEVVYDVEAVSGVAPMDEKVYVFAGAPDEAGVVFIFEDVTPQPTGTP